MQSTVSDTPLIDICQGREQDDRAALLAAFYRVMGSHRRREVTDIHVRELLTYVLVNNRDGRGVQLSYDDVANTLCCERSTARKVVERACVIFGLLAVTEDRYVRGGQAPNRYSIDWPAVRATNSNSSGERRVARGENEERGAVPLAARNSQPVAQPEARPAATRYHPGATMYHPPATTGQGAATTAHPYKEYTLTSSVTSSLHHHSRPSESDSSVAAVVVSEQVEVFPKNEESEEAGWSELHQDLTELRMSDEGARQAVTAARGRGMTVVGARDYVRRYHELRARDRRVNAGWLHRWLTGRSDPPTQDGAQNGSQTPPASRQRGDARTADESVRERLRYQIIRDGRSRGLSEDVIDDQLRKAGLQ